MGSRVEEDIGGSGVEGSSVSFSSVSLEVETIEDGLGKPVMTGAGNSSPSVAFLDNCLAKSEACHHSRNFNAKMLVGSTNFKLDRSLVCIVRGSNIEVFIFGRPESGLEGSLNAAIAL